MIASSIGAPSFIPLFGLIFIGFVIYSSFSGFEKAAKLRERRAEYEARRATLLEDLSKNR